MEIDSQILSLAILSFATSFCIAMATENIWWGAATLCFLSFVVCQIGLTLKFIV